MKLVKRHKLISAAAGILILAVAGFGLFWFSNSTKAEADNSKWKTFSENNYGFSLDYPGNWSFGASYDRYAQGLIDVEMTNRKCGSIAKICAADCIDFRVLAGKIPEGSVSQALFVQLYEDLLAVKDTNNPELVQKMEIGGKTVYKVLAEGPTLSLNGECGGPLYIFETDTGYFAYVFTGLGENLVNASKETIEKIISSIGIKGKQ
jgi:hypothetical protein